MEATLTPASVAFGTLGTMTVPHFSVRAQGALVPGAIPHTRVAAHPVRDGNAMLCGTARVLPHSLPPHYLLPRFFAGLVLALLLIPAVAAAQKPEPEPEASPGLGEIYFDGIRDSLAQKIRPALSIARLNKTQRKQIGRAHV